MDPFDIDGLIQAAAAQVPDADFGPAGFEEPLGRLLAALRDEARLTPQGTWTTVGRIVQSLKRRRLLSRLERRHPEIADVALPAPVVIVGFPRTGTTLLHNLFAADPANRAIRLWEMREPFAPVDAAEGWAAQVEQVTAQLVDAGYKLSPALVDIHPLKAEWPDECSWLFRNGFATLVQGFSDFVPGYIDWLMQRDMAPDYAYYRRQLQAIVFQRPGAPLVLKDPCHVWHLPELLGALPDARVIHLHRDVDRVVSSFASLCRALQQGTSVARSDAEIGAYAADMLETGMGRLLAARKTLPAERFVDVGYDRLVADPVATVADLYDRLDLPWTPATQAGLEGWLAEGSKLTGRHQHGLADFGLDADDVRARFAPYTDVFARFLEPAS